MINCNPLELLRKSVWRRLNKAKTALRREGRSGCKEEAKKNRRIDNSINHFGFLLFCLHSSKPPSTVSELACEKFLVLAGWNKKFCTVCWTNGWLLEAGIPTDMRSNSMRGSQQGQASIHSMPARLIIVSRYLACNDSTRQCLSSGSEHFSAAHANVQRLKEKKRGSELIGVLEENEKLCEEVALRSSSKKSFSLTTLCSFFTT